jgi:O-antigen/teichoic acid export membrane protein
MQTRYEATLPDNARPRPGAGHAAAAVVRGAGLLLPATLVGNALLLGLDLYVNGVLSTADYGAYGAVRRVLQLGALVGLLGMENAVIRALAGGGALGPAWRAMRWSGTASLAVAGALLVVPGWLDVSAAAMMAGAVSLPFAAVRMVAVSACQARGVMWPRAVALFLLWPIAQFAGMFLLVPRWGLTGSLAAYSLAMALGAGVALAAMRRLPAGDSRPEPPLWSTAAPLWVQANVAGVAAYADQVLLAGLAGLTAAGVYGPVATLLPLFGVGLGALNGSFAPVIAERWRAGDVVGLAGTARKVTRWALVLTVPPSVVCLAVPEAVLALWPNGSPDAATALRVAAACQLVCTGVGSVNYLLIMSGNARDVLVNGGLAVVSNLGLSVVLAPSLGPTGAALANGGAALGANLLGLWQVRRRLGFVPFDAAILRPLAAGALALGVGLAHGGLVVTALVAGGLAVLGEASVRRG